MSPPFKRGQVLSRFPFNLKILLPVLALSLFGLLMVYDASVVISMSRYGHNFHFVTQQAISLMLGLGLLTILAFTPYQLLLKASPALLGLGVLLLLAVFIPGLGVELGGAKSWIRFGPLPSFQPSYPLTIALVLYLAQWLSSPKTDLQSLRNTFGPFLAVVGSILFIVAVPQGDFGTAILMGTTCVVVYFLANAPLRHLLLLAPLAGLAGMALVIMQPYRLERIATFLSGGQTNTDQGSYQINQLMIALGSGGLFGQGLGQSRQKYEWLPVVESDSIFAVIGEELGFLGAVIVIAVFVFLFWQCYQVARKAPDQPGQLLVAGIVTFIALQAFTNLMAIVGLIPLTGVTLPFISSGGTSLLVVLAATGIILNVSRQTTKIK